MHCVALPILAQVWHYYTVYVLNWDGQLLFLSDNFILFQVGIAIGGLSALAPSRFNTFAKLALKAMIAGNITNFISGSSLILHFPLTFA